MAKPNGVPNYDADEIAIVVIALEEGHSLSTVATYLHRDRSGLHRVLRRLGYPTRPPKADPQSQRQAVEEAIASVDVWTRTELSNDLEQVRRISRAIRALPPSP